MLKLDPGTVPSCTYDRHTTWVGSIHTGTEDDLWDASPGLLTLPDGRAGTFMTASGPPDLVGVSGIGPAPFGPFREADAQWEAPELSLDEAGPPWKTEEQDGEQQAVQEQERAQRRGMTAEDLQARYRVRWIPD
ncbi:hypothetical protein [Streptomyces sp. NPDC055709]